MKNKLLLEELYKLMQDKTKLKYVKAGIFDTCLSYGDYTEYQADLYIKDCYHHFKNVLAGNTNMTTPKFGLYLKYNPGKSRHSDYDFTLKEKEFISSSIPAFHIFALTIDNENCEFSITYDKEGKVCKLEFNVKELNFNSKVVIEF